MKYIFANFKMNMGLKQTEQYIKEVLPRISKTKHNVVLFPTFINLGNLKKELKKYNVEFGAQNITHSENGMLTGEISALMLKELGVTFVLIGHSSRRQYLSEKNGILNKKILNALNHNLNVVLCVGESLKDRQTGTFKEKVKKQLLDCLKNVDKKYEQNVFIAYEPVWAIGENIELNIYEIEESLGFVKECLKELNLHNAKTIYGGNVNEQNSKQILNCLNVDGVLVGRACLDGDKFEKICLD